MNEQLKTRRLYSFLWGCGGRKESGGRSHYEIMQEAIPEKIVRGDIGIELGCGKGRDAYIMAKNNKDTKIFGIDISDGVYYAASLPNIYILQASVLNIPARKDSFDFAYSFGVLHHTPDPRQGLREIARVIKRGSPAFLYLYEDHSDNPAKYLGLQIIKFIRIFTARIPAKLLYILSFLASPFIVFFFSYPAKILARFKTTRSFSEKIPFHFGTHLFSLRADLYDRFGAPIEHRFKRKEIVELFEQSGFADVALTKIRDRAGWVCWGHKK